MTYKFGTGDALHLACRGGKTAKDVRHLHVHCTCTLHSSPLNRTAPSTYNMRRSTHLPSLVSLAQIFLTPKDPTSKKFFDPGACNLHPQERQPQKHTGWGRTRVTCMFVIGGVSRLTYKDPDKFLQAFTRRHVPRATCVAHTWKVQKHASAGWVYPPWKFGANLQNRFNARGQEPRQTDRRREGQTDRKCQHIPSMDLRNTKDVQMLTHMNFLLSSYDFGIPIYVLNVNPNCFQCKLFRSKVKCSDNIATDNCVGCHFFNCC